MFARLAPVLLILACGTKDEGPAGSTEDTGAPWRPDLVCPGDPTCPDADGALLAGAAAVSITPTCFEAWRDCGDDALCEGDEGYVEADGGELDGEYDERHEVFLDCGCDRLCPEDEGYPGKDDGEADGVFQALWLAGFGNGRPAAGVHDDLWARSIALQQGETTIAIVSLDVVGFFFDDVEEVRAAVDAADVGVDHVIVTSTHVHEAPDSLGQWGKAFGQRGVDDDWLAYVKAQTTSAVVQSVAALEKAELIVATADTSTYVPEKGTLNLIDDHRDPRIVDEDMGIAWLRGTRGNTIATLINYGNHPEVLADKNLEITSDFSHYLREGMEKGVQWESGDIEGLGGVCIYLQGAVGGMMTPLGVTVLDNDGNEFSERDFDKAQALGFMMASQALEELQGREPEVDPSLSLKVARMYLPMVNTGFQALFIMDVFVRDAHNYDPSLPVNDANRPELLTEMDLLDLGPIRMLSVPGELLPELAVGGYDGSHTNVGDAGPSIIHPDNPNPPDLSQAPEGPYLKERMGSRHNWILGLGNDEVGYVVPPYNFKLHESLPYLDEAEGDHYEETNSLGPDTAPRVEEMADRLIEWSGSDG